MAFTLVEILICVAVIGVMFVALYSGFSAGFAIIQLARENLRATQILQEKMETIRLYTWQQVNQPGFIPTNFVESFYATSTNAAGRPDGLIYKGKVTIGSSGVSETYSNDLRMVTMEIKWESAGVSRKREMTTFVSRYGLQNYIY